ncbi:MAG: site-specific integrase [Anaerolineaceae bacterium]|nr:site-specific integrase [Anaerolineaceae bacterium]
MGETTLRQALTEYVGVHLAAKNYAARTRVEYAHDLEELAAFLEAGGIHPIGEINVTQLERHLANLDKQGLAGSTRKRKAIAFRSFLFFLFWNRYISYGIFHK